MIVDESYFMSYEMIWIRENNKECCDSGISMKCKKDRLLCFYCANTQTFVYYPSAFSYLLQ